MKITAEPRSDQLNADDFIGAGATFTIAGVVPGKAEQKYDIQLVETDRVWRPPPTVRRILISAWGDDSTTWVGHQVTLYRDETVRIGRVAVGGVRISHLSHIDKPLEVTLTASRGKRSPFTVHPLTINPDAQRRSMRLPDAAQDRVKSAIEAFARIGVTQTDLETRLNKAAVEWTDGDVTVLQDYYQELNRDGVTS